MELINVEGIMGVVGTVVKGLIAVAVLAIVFLIARVVVLRRQFRYEAEIYERDNLGHLNAYKDKFGIIVNKKSNMEMGRLLKSKDWIGLSDMNYSVIRMGRKLIRRVSLLRLGEGQYIFLKPDIHNPDGVFNLNLTREDIDWGINTFIGCTQTYAYKDRLRELAPMLVMFLMVVGIIVLGVFLIKQFEPLTEALKSTGQQLVTVTENLKAASFAQGGVVQ